jgi:hypothetical protein
MERLRVSKTKNPIFSEAVGAAYNEATQVADQINKHAFTSGATSSERIVPYHLIPPSFITATAARFGLGLEKHGDVNYQKCVTLEDDGAFTLDVEFARDRYNHGVHHLLNLKKTGNHRDDNIGAVAWFLSFATWIESFGFNWERILNPKYVNETTFTIHPEKRTMLIKAKSSDKDIFEQRR